MSKPGGLRKVTTKSLIVAKQQGEPIACLTAYDYITAKLLDRAGVDLLLVGDSLGNVFQGNETPLPVTLDEIIYHAKAVVKGVERAMVVVDMPFMTYQTNADEALRNAGRIMKETGAGAVKLEGGGFIIETVRRITEVGIPVLGHLGLTPQSVHQFGSYAARGTEQSEAQTIRDNARKLEQAGAFGVVLEKVPALLGKEISEELTIPTISIGAGRFCDGQILVTPDMLGLEMDFSPRFLRRYARLAETIHDAVSHYVDDVKAHEYPSEAEGY
jgi:3-methyl-2-oxobutanoate hydroxymethyltransferase